MIHVLRSWSKLYCLARNVTQELDKKIVTENKMPVEKCSIKQVRKLLLDFAPTILYQWMIIKNTCIGKDKEIYESDSPTPSSTKQTSSELNITIENTIINFSNSFYFGFKMRQTICSWLFCAVYYFFRKLFKSIGSVLVFLNIVLILSVHIPRRDRQAYHES